MSYAARVSPRTYLGGGVGGGFEVIGATLLGGAHFAEYAAYEARDDLGNEQLYDLAWAHVFVRRDVSRRWQAELGLRASAFLHGTSADDDPAPGVFLGAYAEALYGWSWLKIGPRIMVGRFEESGVAAELGVYVIPLVLRLEARF